MSSIYSKIQKIDETKYKHSNVDEMRRIILMSKSIRINRKYDYKEVFEIILRKILLINDEISVGDFEYSNHTNKKFIVEEYVPAKKISIAYLNKNDIYRISYKKSFFFRRLTYSQSVKREKRFFGTQDWINNAFWRKNARKQAKRFFQVLRDLLMKKNNQNTAKNNN